MRRSLLASLAFAVACSPAPSEGEGEGEGSEGEGEGEGEPDDGDPLPAHAPFFDCGAQPGGSDYGAHVLRYEDDARTVRVTLSRRYVDFGVGESRIFALDRMQLAFNDGTCVDVADALTYENSHHNWADLASATAGATTWKLALNSIYIGETVDLSRVEGDVETPVAEALQLTGSPFFCQSCTSGNSLITSEVQLANTSTLADADGDHGAWIEFRFPAIEDVDLGGYFLSNDPADPQKWAIPAGIVVPGLDVVVLFLDGKDTVDSDGVVHASFALSAAGDWLMLTDPFGNTAGERFFSATPTDASWVFDWTNNHFMLETSPTPGEVNPTDPQE